MNPRARSSRGLSLVSFQQLQVVIGVTALHRALHEGAADRDRAGLRDVRQPQPNFRRLLLRSTLNMAVRLPPCLRDRERSSRKSKARRPGPSGSKDYTIARYGAEASAAESVNVRACVVCASAGWMPRCGGLLRTVQIQVHFGTRAPNTVVCLYG